MFVKHLPPARSEYLGVQHPITKPWTKEGLLTQRYYRGSNKYVIKDVNICCAAGKHTHD